MYPIKVTIRDTLKSTVLTDHITKKAQKLNQFSPKITTCRIVVDMPQKHKHQGKLFRVSIELIVKGKELVVNRKLNEDVYIAVAQAFDAIERKLEVYAHRKVNNIRKRQRDAGNNKQMVNSNTAVNNDSFKDSLLNDEFYHDEEYEDLSSILKYENIINDY